MTNRPVDKNRSGPQSPPPSYAGYPPNSPQPYYQQPQQPGYEMASHQYSHPPAQKVYDQQHGQGYGQQPQVVYVQSPPQKVVVRDKRHTKDDVALGFCAGCATAACCCGCTVM